MTPPRHFETFRLRFRPPRPDDAPVIFDEYAQDPEVTRYLFWRPHTSMMETEEFLKRCVEVWLGETIFPWVLIRKEDNQLLGMLEINVDGCRIELGYVLARRHWGRGYMTESVQAVIKWALGQESVFRVWAVCDIDNEASARVLQKAGMQEEGILRKWSVFPNRSPRPRDVRCFSIVKS